MIYGVFHQHRTVDITGKLHLTQFINPHTNKLYLLIILLIAFNHINEYMQIKLMVNVINDGEITNNYAVSNCNTHKMLHNKSVFL